MPAKKSAITRWDSLRDPDNAKLLRPTRTDSLVVPEGVELSKGVLSFAWSAEVPAPIRVPDTLLERFLIAKSDGAILHFARKYGPLRAQRLYVLDPHPREWHERISEWRRHQRLFSGLLGLAANLRNRESISRETLEALSADGLEDVFEEGIVKNWDGLHPSDRRIGGAVALVSWTRMLVQSAGVKPALTFDPRESEIRFDLVFQDSIDSRNFGGVSLFGALVIQLLAAVAGSGFAVCSSCGTAYVPTRRPRSHGRHYCRDCGRAAALRDAKAEYRKRLRESAQDGRRPK